MSSLFLEVLSPNIVLRSDRAECTASAKQRLREEEESDEDEEDDADEEPDEETQDDEGYSE